ncbi:hypothetical protein HDV01_006183 [Terramyces sp. JEL0728]|nr:hypothetical protein HDV01_006183 [Terramyces sp. JEL0728]
MFDVHMRIVEHNSRDYEEEVRLRSRLLREPLGLHFTKEELDQESSQLHVCAFIIDRLVGCIVMIPAENYLKMRQVAVDDSHQGLGIGRLMVQYCEKYGKDNGYHAIKLHARETAVKFYTNMDYTVEGDRFLEVGIPHFAITKVLK